MKKKVFEIFTDAGSFNNGRQRYPNLMQLSSSAGVLTYDGEIITGFNTLNPNTTNSYGEIYAIYIALKESINIIRKLDIEKPYKIDLYSDSIISVKGLTTWIKDWKKTAKKHGGIYYNSSNKEVINQEIFKMIDGEFLANPDFDIHIYHIRGHRNIKNPKDLKKAYDTFLRANEKDIDYDKLKFIITMNNICDRYAGIILNRGIGKYVRKKENEY